MNKYSHNFTIHLSNINVRVLKLGIFFQLERANRSAEGQNQTDGKYSQITLFGFDGRNDKEAQQSRNSFRALYITKYLRASLEAEYLQSKNWKHRDENSFRSKHSYV